MNIAAILAMLLASGACAKSDFHGTDSTELRVVVCPVLAAPGAEAPDPAPPPPPVPKKDERQAAG